NDAQILRGDARAGRAEHLEHANALRDLIRLIRGHECRRAVLLAYVGTEEADEMIDAVAVVERRVAARSLREPAEAARRDLAPAIRGNSPVLAGRRKGIRRRADGRVEPEVLLPRPDVGAVAADHERKVAEHTDVHVVARALPLLCCEPLKIRVVENLGFEV